MRKHVLQLAPIYGIKFLAAFLYSVTCDVKTGKAVQTLQQLPARHGVTYLVQQTFEKFCSLKY